MNRPLVFKRHDGKDCPGYLFEPDVGGDLPGVVVIQEWWGVDDGIKSTAARLASHGYRALVPDLYRGKVTLEAAEAAHLMNHLDFVDAATQDVRGAASHLRQGSSKVAVLGLCLGGALAILAAIHVPELDAVCSWYGLPPAEAGDPRRIRAPLQGHWAQQDPYFPPAAVDALEASLRQGGVAFEFYRYDAPHAFGHEGAPYFDRESAELAWQRSLEFLAKHCRR